jgi:hypothetical protein
VTNKNRLENPGASSRGSSLEGLKIAAAGSGSATNSKLNVALTKGGLTYKDSQNVNMSYPPTGRGPDLESYRCIDYNRTIVRGERGQQARPLSTGAINGSTTMTVIRMVDPRPAVALPAAQISLA